MKTDTTSPSDPVKILIAEDSLTQAQRLRHALERRGYQVAHAANGRLALESARQQRPTLIISDVVMPEMDGYEFCRSVKSDSRLSGIPVILVTTLSDPQDVMRGLECLADNFILKPYDETHLLGRVEYILSNRAAARAQDSGNGVDVYFNGLRHTITADRRQILDLLLSTYDAAIQRNKELTRSKQELHRVNAKLEAANTELESFSYSISHDLHAPLRHISAFIDILAKSAMPKLDENERDLIERIARSAGKMSQLIDDLLEFSRMNRTELRHASVDLNQLVTETIRRLEPETAGRNIAWKIERLPSVRGDRAMLEQVFVNLLSNGIKYSRPRAQAEIAVGTRKEAQQHVIFVRDNGVGFNMSNADKLFGVFQRLHSAKEFEGTGVGLANVRRIIDRHGGRTWAESKVNEGATFYFSLPELSDAPV